MKTCSTCSRQWDSTIERCPEDGTVLPAVAAALAPTGTGEVTVAAVPWDDVLAPGTVVGEYRIEKAIGEGGMGVVYGAVHPLIGKRAAIKVLHGRLSADREGVARFVQEAQAVNKIGHANIVDVFAFGTLPDGRAYFVMEWLQGETLEARIARRPLPVSEAATIVLGLARALEAAHAAGVIHRDLKPENVFLVEDDESFRVKLLDFGIAKLSTAQLSTSRTATGMTVGTPLYMSPEQARGVELDARTDVYSLGIVAYEMVCGRSPFEGEPSAVEVLHAHLAKPPRAPRELRPDLPAAFEELILAMLAKPAAERPALADVRRIASSIATRSSPLAIPSDTVSATEPRRIAAREPEPRRRRTGAIVATLVGVAVVTVGLVAYVTRAREPARHAATPTEPTLAAPVPAPVEAPSEPSPSIPTPSSEVTPPPIAPILGKLELVFEPAGANVSVDGKPIALDRGQVRLDIEAGTHVVKAFAAGYHPTAREVNVSAERPARVVVRLVRVHTPTPTPARPASDADAIVDPFRRKKQP